MSITAHEKNSCRCLSCNYLLYVSKYNEDINGDYDLKVYCQLIDCPFKRQERIRNKKQENKKLAAKKIEACIEMLTHCIELKSSKQKGRKEDSI